MYQLNLNPQPDESVPPLQMGPSTDPIVSVIDGADIASWGRRLGAYGVDSIVCITIVLALDYSGHPLPARWSSYMGALILIVYMTLMQVLTHNTIGKYIFGMQVVNEYDPGAMPSLGKLVLRETVGRALGAIGYLFHLRDPRRQGWNDLMADTIVVSRPVNGSLRTSLIAGVAVCFVTVFALFTYRTAERNRQGVEMSGMIAAESRELGRLQREIDRLRLGRGSFGQIQENQRNVLPLLDRYENSIRHVQTLIGSLLDQKLVLPDKIAGVQAARPVYVTLLKMAEVEREQANLILAVPPGQSSQILTAQLKPLVVQLLQLQMTLFRENRAIQASLPAGKQKGAR